MHPSAESLPRLDEVKTLTRCIEASCIVGAWSLLLLLLIRLSTLPGLFTWWAPALVLAAMLLADFTSGIVHWSADTWGSESMPVLGRRFLRPFRVHHVNPDDFLRRNFIDTNGDVAMIIIPVLLSAFLIRLDTGLGPMAALFLGAFSACALPTNQVHQWAHMNEPPSLVRWLQRGGLLLSYEQHQMHHTAPYVTNYCIANGWCNRTLTALAFFPGLERNICRLTGFTPRSDDSTVGARSDSVRAADIGEPTVGNSL